VIKYLLGRKSGFHDLAFFDPDMYESLRQLIVDAKNQVIHSGLPDGIFLNQKSRFG
jgi:hypothetical protein